jgi:type IV pilus assembly protein PilX
MNCYVSTMQTQTGAVLFISLVFLLILSLIGITGMQTATLEERMSGNLRDETLSQQAAEAALRAGENWLDSPTQTDPWGLATTACTASCADKVYSAKKADGTVLMDPYDDSTWSSAAVRSYTTGSLSNVYSAPTYYIELLAELGPPDESGATSTGTIVAYRITARGIGGSNTSQTLLQSTYTTRF